MNGISASATCNLDSLVLACSLNMCKTSWYLNNRKNRKAFYLLRNEFYMLYNVFLSFQPRTFYLVLVKSNFEGFVYIHILILVN